MAQSRNRRGRSSHARAPGEQAGRLDRVAVPWGQDRTLAFVRGTVLQVEDSQLILADPDGRQSKLRVTAETRYGTLRLPTTAADVVPGAVVAAAAEQLEGQRDLALRIAVIRHG